MLFLCRKNSYGDTLKSIYLERNIIMKYEKPDMKVFKKKSVKEYEDGVAFMHKEGIGKTIVCTGKGGISVDVSQLEDASSKKNE